MSEYFSHDTNARNDMKCAKLIKKLGYKGYGVFWAIVELMNEQSDCQLPADFAQLSWQLHVSAKTIEDVVRNYGLFAFSEDGAFFWSRTARRRLELRQTKGKRGRPAKNVGNTFPEKPGEIDRPNANCAESSKTPQNCVSVGYVVNDSTSTPKVSQNANETASVQFQPTTFEEHSENSTQDGWEIDQPNESEQIIAEWNKVFKGTKQECRWGGVTPPAVWHDWTEAKKLGYTLKDLFAAFRVAKNDDWAWQLKHVMKGDNIQQLLTKKEKASKNGSGNLDFMEGKQYFDANGKPAPKGGEFVSAEFWNDLKANKAIVF